MELNLASIVLAAFGVSCLVLSGFFLTQEIGEINRKLPEDQQISYRWMYAEKYARIRKEYRRLYPNGRIHTLGVIFEFVGFVLLVLAAVAAGFFRTS
jgi:hypothetical protein